MLHFVFVECLYWLSNTLKLLTVVPSFRAYYRLLFMFVDYQFAHQTNSSLQKSITDHVNYSLLTYSRWQ